MILEELINSIEAGDIKRFGEITENLNQIKEEIHELNTKNIDKEKLEADTKEKTILIKDLTDSIKVLELDLVNSKKQLEELKDQNLNLNNEIKALLDEIAKLKEIQGSNPQYIRELEDKLRDAQQNERKLSSEMINLPIINNEMMINPSIFICIKEIKPALYLNNLIEYMQVFYELQNKYQNKRCFLLVLDPLTDKLRRIKYEKHSLPINEYKEGNSVLISNKNGKDINTIVNLSNFDIILVIDRFRETINAVDNKNADTYYLIDSPSDIIDYNLPREKCIIYSINQSGCGFSIDPSVDFSNINDKYKSGLIGETPFVKGVLTWDTKNS